LLSTFNKSVSLTVVLVPDLYLDFSGKSGLVEMIGDSGFAPTASSCGSGLDSIFCSDAEGRLVCVGRSPLVGVSLSDVTLIFFLTHLADGSID
jgi:hypothetical protein